jgi:hypothetical protein
MNMFLSKSFLRSACHRNNGAPRGPSTAAPEAAARVLAESAFTIATRIDLTAVIAFPENYGVPLVIS